MVKIINQFNLSNDPKMRFLDQVLSPVGVREYFEENISLLLNNYQLSQVKVIRYKVGKRCLIEYTFEGKNTAFTLIGKVRAKGTDTHSYSLQKYLWDNGFGEDSQDKISVPEAVGVIPSWQMWLQKKVAGEVATNFFTPSNDDNLSKKIAHLVDKLHRLSYPISRIHTMADELAILHHKLPLVVEYYPSWDKRIKELLKKCDRLGEKTPSPSPLSGIHRDFYFDQIIVNHEHLYLLDLDLYCQGDPSLDIGNFIGHLTEYALRKYGDFQALKHHENALEAEFIKLSRPENIYNIKAYTVLTLVRHIYLSNQFSDRLFTTEILFDLCQDYLQELISE